LREGLAPLTVGDRVYVFDTTLRDGEQTPGVALTPDKKVEIARQLDELGVDVIEAGFPSSSEGDFEGVRRVASLGLRSRVAALARSVRGDVDRALDAGVDRVHVFIATSDLHLQYKLKMSREKALESAVSAVEYAKSHGVEVEFSAEDATRSDPAFLREVFSAVSRAGADVIDVPDTVGVATPERMAELVRLAAQAAPGKLVSVHCHDDFGLAVANSIAGVLAGAGQFHATINGIGERAGNAALEEVALALKFLYGRKLGIRPELIYETSRLVARLTGIYPPPNKAIVGENAFGHESGIHVHGVLEMPSTYEPISPETVGRRRFFVAGKHAGSHGIEAMLREYGIDVSDDQLRQIVAEVKRLGDLGKKVTDADLLAIARSVVGRLPAEAATLSLRGLVVVTGMGISPTASVRVRLGGRDVDASSTGVGPVDAALRALQSVVREVAEVRLVEYRLEAITGGSDALGEVVVRLEDDAGNVSSARSVGPDIVMASVDAMVDGINKILWKRSARDVRVQDSGDEGGRDRSRGSAGGAVRGRARWGRPRLLGGVPRASRRRFRPGRGRPGPAGRDRGGHKVVGRRPQGPGRGDREGRHSAPEADVRPLREPAPRQGLPRRPPPRRRRRHAHSEGEHRGPLQGVRVRAARRRSRAQGGHRARLQEDSGVRVQGGREAQEARDDSPQIQRHAEDRRPLQPRREGGGLVPPRRLVQGDVRRRRGHGDSEGPALVRRPAHHERLRRYPVGRGRAGGRGARDGALRQHRRLHGALRAGPRISPRHSREGPREPLRHCPLGLHDARLAVEVEGRSQAGASLRADRVRGRGGAEEGDSDARFGW